MVDTMENNSVNAVKTISVVGLGYVGLPFFSFP